MIKFIERELIKIYFKSFIFKDSNVDQLFKDEV